MRERERQARLRASQSTGLGGTIISRTDRDSQGVQDDFDNAGGATRLGESNSAGGGRRRRRNNGAALAY